MGFDESRNDGCPLVIQQFAVGNFRQIQLIQLLVSDITAPKFSCEGSTLAAITIITTIWGMVLTGSYNPRQYWGWFMAVYQNVLIFHLRHDLKLVKQTVDYVHSVLESTI